MSSPAALANAGVKAVTAGNYADGIEKLSQALKERPAPLWLLERSKAYVRANKLDLALHDAEKALHVAFERANRDYMIEAQIRRAVALFRLGRYADADICAFWALRLIDKAKATEDDGQQNKVDANGDYVIRVDEVENEAKPDKNLGLTTAMGGGRSKNNSMKNQAITWRLQALRQLEKLPVGHPGRKVTVAEKYPKPSELPSTSRAEAKPTPADTDGDAARDGKTASAPNETAGRHVLEKLWEQFREVHAKKAIRSSFYQTDTTLTADLFVKNTDASRFSVTADEQKITTCESPSIHLYLWGKIKPDETKYTVKPMKIELVLRKETPGKWPILQRENAAPFSKLSSTGPTFDQFTAMLSFSGYDNPDSLQLPAFDAAPDSWYSSLLKLLEVGLDGPKASGAEEPPKVPSPTTEASTSARGADATMQPQVNPTSASKPAADPNPTNTKKESANTGPVSAQAYPTSSKKGAVNWDKLGDVDADEDEDAKNDVNFFFQKLYKDADDDTKRAMMKSYVESNGTSLSTNWNEAREKTYKTSPPNGAEAKKWD
ncbi:SGS-domain-containing protein [Hypoxylon cercidicola]|nr:SGS-domain-containing protein [Hypoxylon cercidicola]